MRLKAKVAPTYGTPFTHESEPWGARTLLSVQPRHPDIAAAAEDSSTTGSNKTSADARAKEGSPLEVPLKVPLKVSVVSYNVLADSNSVRVRNCRPSVLNWGRRREILLREIFSVRADVLCLQDVESFHQWWGPQLTGAGYDSLYKQRTNRAAMRRDGVVIAWKRDVFDLLRSEELELNRLGEHEEDRLLAGKVGMSDNVALMALLQPWQDSNYPTGACVVCTELFHEQGAQGDAVRSLQACGLTRTIEAFNSDFHLPVILCGTMNCAPSSGVYEIICRGVEAQDPSQPGPPGKPLVEPLSTSTALIRWSVPQENSESLSPAIDLYKVLWVPGGSRFLSGESVGVRESDCVGYDFVEAEGGKFKSEQSPLRSFTVTGLSSGVAYEFRVAAVNSLGQGGWSERSEPACMPRMAGNDPESRVLLGVASIKLIRKRELEATRQRTEEKFADPRAYELRKLVKVDGMVDLVAEKLHPFDSVSGMTPRYSDAVLHPHSANVRTDNGFPITEAAPKRTLPGVVSSAAGRRRRRREKKDARDPVGLAVLSLDDNTGFITAVVLHDEQSAGDASGSVPEADDGRGEGDSSQLRIPGDAGSMSRSEARKAEPNDCRADTIGAPLDLCTNGPPSPPGEHERSKVERLPTGEDSGRETSVLFRLAALNVRGARSERQKHALGLRSAYMSYSSGGEPAFTTLSDTYSGTVDYIFFSANCLLPLEVLSLPEMGSLEGRDVQQTELAPAPGSRMPKDWRQKPLAQGFRGEWLPYLRENSKIVRHQIPNDRFPSDHLMLMANMLYFEPRCSSTWR